jgi:phosphoglucomutase/phosphomannomutase
MVPDGAFPTVAAPNPEYAETLHEGLLLLQKTSSDILLATDPDADRIGVAILHENKPFVFSGNDIACICTQYLCQNQKLTNPAVVTTIVSTDLIETICKSHQVQCFKVLTGFKYIAEKIRQWELQKNAPSFLFGAEESFGYLYGTNSRDKDAIVTGCLLAKIALQCKLEQKTLLDYLFAIYHKYGVFKDKVFSLDFSPGKAGIEEIQTLMQTLRKNPFQELCGIKVSTYIDYQKDTDLPKSDVLLFCLEDGSKLVIRPSGTEPKLKIYAGVHLPHFTSLPEALAQAETKLSDLLQALSKNLKVSA